MDKRIKFTSIVGYMLLISSVVLVQGCGSPIADDLGCPSGTYLANSTDVITASPDVTFTGLSFVGSVFPGGSVLFTPVTFTVTGEDGVPRNNICLLAYTGDTAASPGPFWYADARYADGTVIYGTGPYNARAIVTNDAGVAMVYWSTAVLPSGVPRTMTSAGPPPTYVAGADQSGRSFIQVYSGAVSATFNATWTVQGEPAQ